MSVAIRIEELMVAFDSLNILIDQTVLHVAMCFDAFRI